MFCPECGNKCEVVIDSFCRAYLCPECDQMWYVLHEGVYYSESALAPDAED